MENSFIILARFFGNHTIVAKKLGITARYYREIRSGRIKPSQPLKKLIYEISKQIKNSNP